MRMQIAIYLMVYGGSLLMAINIYLYVRFSEHIRQRGNWDREHRILMIPIFLLVMFLAGYLIIGILGHPDLVMAAILFGGSIFVLLMVILIRRAVDRIQENEQLEAELLAAEEANKAKTFFLSNMSHDIRTPLNAIIGYTTLARREGTTAEDQANYIDKIEKAGNQLLDIVNDVLEMSRIESGQIHLELASMDLEGCILEAADMVRNQLAMKDINFTVSCQIRHKWVKCDKHLLNRALMNLLCNAGKFTETGGRVAFSADELDGDGQKGLYEIRIADNGIGMSQEFVSQIFNPFERERTSTVSGIEGTGLGMAITKSIVDLMKGEIQVNTKKGQGTEFIIQVTFPIAEAEKEESSPGTGSYRFDGMRVLLVEDNPINTEIALMLLTESGFEIETAENGRMAVDTIASSEPGHFDLVLMDIQMPVMDGYEAARAIRALDDQALASLPLIAMTANAFREDEERALEAGMQGHIAKPLDPPAMMETIHKVLEKDQRSS